MGTEDVRYGRARLSIERSGTLTGDDDLGRAVDRLERAEATPEDVALAFVRERIVRHSPSFNLDDADLDRVVALVAERSAEPRVHARTAAELAAEVLAARVATRRAAEVAAAPVVQPRASGRRATRAARAGWRAAVWTASKAGWVGSKVGRILPSRWRWRVALLALILLVAGGGYSLNRYLDEKPDELADEYRERAQPAADRITDAMDRVYESFDTYLGDFAIPVRDLRNAKEFDEIRRRLLPVYDATEKALAGAQRAIDNARKQIKRHREDLRGVPTAFLVKDSEPQEEARKVVTRGDEYIRRSLRYLKDWERFVAFDRKAVKLRRSSTKDLDANSVPISASLDTYKSALAADLERAKGHRAGYLKLDPHPDGEGLYKNALESATISVDYLEDLLAGYNNLSIAQVELAGDDLDDAGRRLHKRGVRLVAEFRANSGLQKESRKLGGKGDALEVAIAALGTGEGNAPRGDHYRPPLPPAPDKDKGGSGGADGNRSES